MIAADRWEAEVSTYHRPHRYIAVISWIAGGAVRGFGVIAREGTTQILPA